MFRTVRNAVLVALFSVAALAACSGHSTGGQPTIAKADLEKGVSDALQRSVGQRPDSVDCPDAVKATAGQTARCTLTSGSTHYGLTVTIKAYSDGQATYDVAVDNKPSS